MREPRAPRDCQLRPYGRDRRRLRRPSMSSASMWTGTTPRPSAGPCSKEAPPGTVVPVHSVATTQILAGEMPLQLSEPRSAPGQPARARDPTPYACHAPSSHQRPFGRATLIDCVRFESDAALLAERCTSVRSAVPDHACRVRRALTPHGVPPLPMGITPWGAADRLHTVVITRTDRAGAAPVVVPADARPAQAAPPGRAATRWSTASGWSAESTIIAARPVTADSSPSTVRPTWISCAVRA